MNNRKYDNEVVALGTGTSTGVPMLGCKCEVCSSSNPKNHRFRSSVALKTSAGNTIIVDLTPDLRTQLLTNKISECDACIITHSHADHVHGIDDLRPLSFHTGEAIPVYTHPQCADELRDKFPYIFQAEKVFKSKAILGGGIPKLELFPVMEKALVAGEEFEFFLLPHGHTKSLSFRHKKMAYAIDCKSLPNEWVARLKEAQLDLLILDCVKREPHQTHLHLEASLKFAKQIGAKRTALIHMGHEFEHEQLLSELKEQPIEIFPLHDGQSLTYGN